MSSLKDNDEHEHLLSDDKLKEEDGAYCKMLSWI